MKRLLPILILMIATATVGQGAITRTQNVSANAVSATLTSTTSGDLIVVFAYSTSTTIPTVPGGYTTITATAGTQQAASCGYKISSGGETSTGSWTNAASVVCLVYSGTASTIGNVGTLTAGSSTFPSYPSINPLSVTNGTSIVVGFAGAKSATSGMATNPASGGDSMSLIIRTNQTIVNGADSPTGTGPKNAQALTISPTSRWFCITIELKVPAVGPTAQQKAAFLQFFP